LHKITEELNNSDKNVEGETNNFFRDGPINDEEPITYIHKHESEEKEIENNKNIELTKSDSKINYGIDIIKDGEETKENILEVDNNKLSEEYEKFNIEDHQDIDNQVDNKINYGIDIIKHDEETKENILEIDNNVQINLSEEYEKFNIDDQQDIDNQVIIPPQIEHEENNSLLKKYMGFFAVYDGHGGERAAEYAKIWLHHNILRFHNKILGGKIKDAIKKRIYEN